MMVRRYMRPYLFLHFPLFNSLLFLSFLSFFLSSSFISFIFHISLRKDILLRSFPSSAELAFAMPTGDTVICAVLDAGA